MATRVLHVIGQIAVGGCEMQLLEICRRTDRSRFELSVCYYAPRPDSMEAEFRQTGVGLHYVDKPRLTRWRFLRGLRAVVRKVRPDIIHCWQASPCGWGRLAGWAEGCRRFVCSERTTRVMSFPWWVKLFERALARRTIWTANSSAVASAMMAALPIAPRRMRVIHNAVEVPPRDRAADRADARRELGLAPDQPIVLSVGRLTEAKNYPLLVRAAKIVLQARPDVRFLVAGQGEEGPRLRAMLAEMDLADPVRLLGLRHDVPRLMHAADVFCLCSLWEGFPNALAEAMAVGLPAVATAVAGLDEFFQPGRTGLAVPLDDAAALAGALLDLLHDEPNRSALADAARQWVQDRFSWPRLIQDMQALYAAVE